MIQKQEEIIKGKAKSVFATQYDDRYVLHFRDDTSAFDGKKIEQLDRKGMVNNIFNVVIMQRLEAAGIPTQLPIPQTPTESVVLKLDMMPVEFVVRNITAGSICRRLGVESGLELNPPTFELFLKNDDLGDPMINECHIQSFNWCDVDKVAEAKALSYSVNAVLKPLFLEAGLLLVDYKLEFGLDGDGVVRLGDEFTPDGCRLWDIETRESLDKDRFRQEMGGVVEAYEIVGRRIGINFDSIIELLSGE